MKEKLLENVEEIINTLACNDAQPIEVRGAFNAAINLRAMLEQINADDMMDVIEPVKKPKEAPTKWRIPGTETTETTETPESNN